MATQPSNSFDPSLIGATPVNASDFDPTSIGAAPVDQGNFFDKLGAKAGQFAQGVDQAVVGNFLQPLAEAAVRPVQAASAFAGRMIGGDFGKNLETASNMPMDVPLLGPLATAHVDPQKGFGQGGGLQIAGQGLKDAAYIAAGPEADEAISAGVSGKFLDAGLAGAQSGTIGGALFGAGNALQGSDPSLKSVTKGTVGGAFSGAMGGLTIGLGAGGLFGGPVAAGEAARDAKSAAGEAFDQATAKVFNTSPEVLDSYTRAVKPSVVGQRTSIQAKDYNAKVGSAVDAIVDNKPNLKFSSESGTEAGRLPQSLQEFSDAIAQTRQAIFKEYNALAKSSGETGATVDLHPISSELDSVIDNKALELTNPGAIQYAKALKARLEKAGSVDPETAEQIIQNYNDQLKSFYRNPSYDGASRAAIDAGVANNMRRALDAEIEGSTGQQYQALKNKYGALKTIEADVQKRAIVNARKNQYGLIDYTNIFSGGDMLSGVLTLNPVQFAKGAAEQAIKAYIKKQSDPDGIIMKMFQRAEKDYQSRGGSNDSSALSTKGPKNNAPNPTNKNDSIIGPDGTIKLPTIQAGETPPSKFSGLPTAQGSPNVYAGMHPATPAGGYEPYTPLDKLPTIDAGPAAQSTSPLPDAEGAPKVFTPKKKANTQGGFVSTGFKDSGELTTSVIGKLEGKTSVSKQYISDLSRNADVRGPEKALIESVLADFPEGKDVPVKEFADRMKTELLPLERTGDMETAGQGVGMHPAAVDGNVRYESITLPEDVRGDVKSYGEHVYQSPIKTSAGDIHFGGEGVDNYFAHTRTEDMADGTTRRVIEAQSDLFQKGRLENEVAPPYEQGWAKAEVDPLMKEISPKRQQEIIDESKKTVSEGEKKIKALEPYRNTWHERIIREEIKQAAKDGKTELQFPTGETAMKIEGLGEADNTWFVPNEGGRTTHRTMTPDDLKVGREIDRGQSKWVVVEVLGDGKFKAVSKSFIGTDQAIPSAEILKNIANSTHAETFDISGKIDTANPIYKFYENDVQKALKKYGGQRITDPQGQSWFQIPITKDMATKPVQAYGKADLGALFPIAGASALGAATYANASKSSTDHYENPTKYPKTGYSAKGNAIDDNDLDMLRKILFSELANKDPKDQKKEAEMITSTVLNRMDANRARGRNLDMTGVLTEPNQYQGYGSKEFKRIESGGTRANDKQKLRTIEDLIGEIKDGTFSEDGGGAAFYKYTPNDVLIMDKKPLFKK